IRRLLVEEQLDELVVLEEKVKRSDFLSSGSGDVITVSVVKEITDASEYLETELKNTDDADQSVITPVSFGDVEYGFFSHTNSETGVVTRQYSTELPSVGLVHIKTYSKKAEENSFVVEML